MVAWGGAGRTGQVSGEGRGGYHSPHFPAGTHDIHALILGRAITGIQAFTADK